MAVASSCTLDCISEEMAPTSATVVVAGAESVILSADLSSVPTMSVPPSAVVSETSPVARTMVCTACEARPMADDDAATWPAASTTSTIALSRSASLLACVRLLPVPRLLTDSTSDVTACVDCSALPAAAVATAAASTLVTTASSISASSATVTAAVAVAMAP